MLKEKLSFSEQKPENIVFDVRGDVKIFDFGLAKELKQEDKVNANHDLYLLTGLTGTMTYMAPEVYKNQPYNQSIDLYSFAHCLWEMFSFSVPYQHINSKELFEKLIINRECRPQIDNKWPLPIKLLLNRAWSANINDRPAAEMALAILRNELVALRPGNETGHHHNKRRSTYVMRKTTGRLRPTIFNTVANSMA